MIKKNITINFCGRLYNIDEDAYEMLMHYTETLRRYYKKEGTEEVADDIEMRIAELLDEQIANGQHAISIEITKAVIDQLGDLDELAPGEEAGEKDAEKKPKQETLTSATTSNRPRKGLYRDMEDCMVCGVLSGFSHYFGGRVGVWRGIAFFIIFMPLITSMIAGAVNSFFFLPVTFTLGIFNFAPVLIYIICALIMPKAIEPEDRLRMHGTEINPLNIAAEINRNPKLQTAGIVHRFFSFIFRLFSGIFGIAFVICLLISIVIFIMYSGNTDGLAVWFFGENTFHRGIFDAHAAGVEAYAEAKWYYVTFWMSVIALLTSLIYCCFHAVTRGYGKRQSMGGLQVLAWVMCIPMFLTIAIYTGYKADKIYDNYEHEYYVAAREAHMHNGYFFSDEEWEFYQKNGWKLLKAENLTDERYTYSGEYFDGDPEVRYIDAYSYNRDLIFQAERTENVEPGTYTLSFYGRASDGGEGAFGYVQVVAEGSEPVLYLQEIPGHGNIPGYDFDDTSASGSIQYGWQKLTIDDIIVPEGATVHYGVSTDKAFTGKYCNAYYFSVTDYSLEKK